MAKRVVLFKTKISILCTAEICPERNVLAILFFSFIQESVRMQPEKDQSLTVLTGFFSDQN